MAEIYDAVLTPGKLELLAPWLGAQRWYAGHGRVPVLRPLFAWRLDDPAGEVGIETHIVADDSGPSPVVYQVPVTYRGAPLAGAEAALVGEMEHSVLGHRWVYDAPHDPVYAAQLLELVQGRVLAQSGRTSWATEPEVTGIPQPRWDVGATLRTAGVLSGEQSNTSVVLDCAGPDGSDMPLIAKVFRVLQPGENPDVVLQGALVESGSRRVPGVVGSVSGRWPDPTRERQVGGHLVFVQEFLPDSPDAWRVALSAVLAGADFTGPARELGAATAEVHRSLAAALGSEPATRDLLADVLGQMHGRYAAAAEVAPALREHQADVAAVLDAAAREPWPSFQRIHADYHLGQVLHSPERGWVLLDFEGEPLRPLAERAQPDQCLRDVAGMLRSLDYAGGTREQDDPGSARRWVADTQQAFLQGYAAESGADPRDRPALLTAFELDKAFYEVVYEARHRPSWLGIPLAAVDRLLDRANPRPSPDQEVPS